MKPLDGFGQRDVKMADSLQQSPDRRDIRSGTASEALNMERLRTGSQGFMKK